MVANQAATSVRACSISSSLISSFSIRGGRVIQSHSTNFFDTTPMLSRYLNRLLVKRPAAGPSARCISTNPSLTGHFDRCVRDPDPERSSSFFFFDFTSARKT